MATFITTDQTSTVSATSVGPLYIVEGVIVTDATLGVQLDEDGPATIAGTVYAPAGVGNFQTSYSAATIALTIAPTGAIYGSNFGVIASSGTTNFDLGSYRLANAGHISAINPVSIDAIAVDIINTGKILNTGTQVESAIFIQGNVFTSVISIENVGLIAGGRSTYRTGAIYAEFAARLELNNSGTIAAQNYGVVSASTDTLIQNSGVIQSGVHTRVVSHNSFIVHNSGEITESANGFAMDVRASTSVLRNSGEMFGDVALNVDTALVWNDGLIGGEVTFFDTAGRYVGTSTARLINGGVIQDDVIFDDQGDLYRAQGDGVAYGTVFGGAGEDSLIGGALSDRLDGGADADFILGQGGNDSLQGGDGADTVRGGDGNDTVQGGNDNDRVLGGNGDDTVAGENGDDFVYGNNGDDTLLGGNGNDSLFGGNDDDVLNGGDGDDRLFGGAGVNQFIGGNGRDVMYAQSGEDTFTFFNASESAVGAQRDVISGYDLGQDIIDLAAVAPGVLTYIHTAAFTGTAREVRIVEYTSGSTIVQVDTDGDGTQDMELMLFRVTGLTEADFVL